MNGLYSVTATSVTGNCSSPPAGTTVAVLPVPVITSSSHVNPVGCNSATGAILLYGLLPSTAYTVQYTKDGGVPVTATIGSNPDGSLIITGLQSGDYTNVHVGLNGCSSNIAGPFVLANTAPFSVLPGSNGPVCETGTLLLTASATAPGSASYAWTGPDGFTSTVQNPVIPNAGAANSGLYEVTITINGCSASGSITATVSQQTIGGSTDADANVCHGNNRGTVQLTGYLGNVIRWESSVNNGASWEHIPNTSPYLNYNNLTITTWFRAVVQNAPCATAYSDITTITVDNSFQSVFIEPTSITTCNHDTTISFAATVIYTGNDPLNYYWLVNGAVEGRANPFTYRFRSELTNPLPETFSIQLLAENAAGCGDTSLPAQVLIHALPNPSIQVSPAVVQREPHYDFTFTDISPASPQKAYTWDMGDTTGQPKTGREVNYAYKHTGSHTVRLFVLDRATGCTARDSVQVTVLPVPGSLYIPNAFYPNSSYPELRTFKLQGIGIKKYRLQIFDAWGKIVFETTELNDDGSPKVAWNGTYLNNGKALPQDAYVWKIAEIEFENGKKWNGMSHNGSPPKYFGNVTLFR